MSRPATARLKVNPPVGSLPVLQYCSPDQLQIDPAYQRSLETGQSQTLIRKIAMFWDWSLCQPLVVSRREDDGLYVVDGQHRHAAAELRGDIHQLPCVITSYASAADEAAAFVAINQERRALNAIDLFRAALAAHDEEAVQITDMLTSSGVTLAPHSNPTAWKPAMLANIGGIRTAYRSLGRTPTSAALVALVTAFDGQVLRYGGSLFSGLARAYAVFLANPDFDPDLFLDVLQGGEQKTWYADILARRGSDGGGMALAGQAVFTDAYSEALAEMLDEAA